MLHNNVEQANTTFEYDFQLRKIVDFSSVHRRQQPRIRQSLNLFPIMMEKLVVVLF
jgi:hypothetical protein